MGRFKDFKERLVLIMSPEEIERLIVKWDPIIKSMTPRAVGLAACLCEAEMLVLRAQSDASPPMNPLGSLLKYIFPVCRRVASSTVSTILTTPQPIIWKDSPIKSVEFVVSSSDGVISLGMNTNERFLRSRGVDLVSGLDLTGIGLSHSAPDDAQVVAYISDAVTAKIDSSIIRALEDNITETVHVHNCQGMADIINGIVKASNTMFRNSQRVSADWVVCGPNIADVLSRAVGFVQSENYEDRDQPSYFGRLNNLCDIIIDPGRKDTDAIVGSRGTSNMDVPVEFTPWALFEPVLKEDGGVALMTNYDVRIANNSYFIGLKLYAD